MFKLLIVCDITDPVAQLGSIFLGDGGVIHIKNK